MQYFCIRVLTEYWIIYFLILSYCTMFTNMFTDLYGSISRLVFSNLGELYVSDTVKHRFLSGFAVNRGVVNQLIQQFAQSILPGYKKGSADTYIFKTSPVQKLI